MARNERVEAVKEFIRQPVAWPGGYPKVAIMADGECLCATCAKANYKQVSRDTRARGRHDGWAVEGVQIHWEGEPLECAHCQTQIESAYGVPETE